MTNSTTLLLAPVLALILSVALTPVVRAFARRIGAVAQPKADRWHSSPTSMLGGVAIFIAVTSTLVLLVPNTREMWSVIGASSALFIVGLVDDSLRLKPYQKLIGQILGASAVIYLGLVLPWTASSIVNMLITFVWLVGVTNAVNMLDNMDGLATGVSAISAVFLAANFWINGQGGEATMLLVFAGALAGFLIFNHNPASIFMGDCGSMFVGFFLASSALLAREAGGGRSRSIVAVLGVPVLVLCIPIFDTTFVTLMRKLSGRAASQGGRDHTSHRLVALGLSERKAVWMLWSVAFVAGALSLAVRSMPIDVSIAVIGSFTIILSFVGIHLARVRVYSEEEIVAAQQKPLISLLVDLSYKRRVFEVFLDVALIAIAYYASYAISFGPFRPTSGDWQLFVKTLPIVVFVKLAGFLVIGLYRGLWRYIAVADTVMFFRAVAGGSAVSILLILFAFRFEGFSRTVFALDFVILLALVTTSRFAFRTLRRLFPAPHSRTGKRVLIFGAGDGGELLARELLNNPTFARIPVGFIDDDPRKSGKMILGLRVHSASTDLNELRQKPGIDEVMVSTTSVSAPRLRTLVATCETAGMPVMRMSVTLERIADRDLGWVLPSRLDDSLQSVDPTTQQMGLVGSHSEVTLSLRGVDTEH